MRSAYYCAVGEVAGFVSGSPATIGFANTWRDEMGRFAEKGYVAASGRGTRWDLEHGEVVWYDEPNGMWTSAAWAKKHYGAAEVALQMTDAERAVLQTELDVKLGTVMDADPTGLASDMTKIVASATRRTVASAGGPPDHRGDGAFVSVVEEFTVGQSMQLVSTYEYLSRNAASRDGAKAALDKMIHDHAKYGEPTASSISEFVASRYLVPQEAGAVSYFHAGWQESSASIRSQVLQDAAHAVFSGPTESRSSFRNFVESHPTYNADKYSVMSGHLSATARSVVSASSRVTADMIGTGDLTLMRGTSNPNIRYGRDFLMNPASSWTNDLETAADFSRGGAVIETVVSKNNVIGYEGIGFGSAKESEYVVAGGIIHSDNWDTIDVFATGIDTDPVYIDGDEYGGPDWIKEVSTGDEASLTIDGSIEFANTWRDELGRFAEKGYVAAPGGMKSPAELEAIGAARRLATDWAKALSDGSHYENNFHLRLTAGEIDQALRDDLSARSAGDEPFLDPYGDPVAPMHPDTYAELHQVLSLHYQAMPESIEHALPVNPADVSDMYDIAYGSMKQRTLTPDAADRLMEQFDGTADDWRPTTDVAVVAARLEQIGQLTGSRRSLHHTGGIAWKSNPHLSAVLAETSGPPRVVRSDEYATIEGIEVFRGVMHGSAVDSYMSGDNVTGSGRMGDGYYSTDREGTAKGYGTTWAMKIDPEARTIPYGMAAQLADSVFPPSGYDKLDPGVAAAAAGFSAIVGGGFADGENFYVVLKPSDTTVNGDSIESDWIDDNVPVAASAGVSYADLSRQAADLVPLLTSNQVSYMNTHLSLHGTIPAEFEGLVASAGTIEHFANPWRDYKGRFAPTGYGRSGRLGPRSLNDDSDRYQSGALQSDAKFAAGLEEWSDSITEDMEKMIGEPVVAKWGHSEADGEQAFFNMSFETLDGREVADIEREFDTDYDGVLYMSASSLFVGGRFRGNGVGTLMQESFEDFAVTQGAERVEVTAVSAGKWAWMKAGYDFNPVDTTPKELEKIAAAISGVAGTSRLTEAERDTAVRYVSEFKNAATHMESNETFPDSMPTPFELSQLLTSVEVTDPVFEFPTWSGIKNLGSGLVASAGGSRVDRVAAVVAAYDVWWLDNMEAVDPTADSYVEFDYSGLDVLVDGGALAASGTIVEFANTWRDEMGRFAEKGYIAAGVASTDMEEALQYPSDAVLAAVSDYYEDPSMISHGEAIGAVMEQMGTDDDEDADLVVQALYDRHSVGMSSDVYLNEISEFYGIERQTAIDTIVESAQKQVDESALSTRMTEESLASVIFGEDDRFKTQFETGDSGGRLDFAARQEAEFSLYGTDPFQTNVEERPIYGYFDVKGTNNSFNGSSRALDGYGQVRVEFDDSVRDRTTVTFDDSLGKKLMPAPARQVHVDAVLRSGSVNIHNPSSGSPYVEAQMHGGVSAANISRVVFPVQSDKPGAPAWSPPSQSVVDRLWELGIPVWGTDGNPIDSGQVRGQGRLPGVLSLASDAGDVWYVSSDGATITYAGLDDQGRPVGYITRDGRVYDENLIIVLVAHGGPWVPVSEAGSASFTMNGSVEFANTWRDEMGRFAEKGYNFVRATKNLTAFETFADDLPQAIEDAYLENVGNPSGYQAVREVIEQELNEAGFDDVMLGEDQHGKYSLGDLIYETVDKRERAATNAADLVEQAASSEGITNEEYEAKFIESAENVLADSEVSIRIDESALEQVVRDGEFKTQFETGTSRGTLNHDIREKAEAIQFGLDPEETDPTDRPIYGYMDVDGANDYSPDNTAKSLGADAYGRQESLSQYGSVRVVLKDSVRGRTTFTSGDSLAMGKRPSPINAPQIDSFANNWELPADIGLDGQNAFSTTMRYVEAQIHGGVMVDDISHVVFESAPSSTGWLDDAGIAHSVAAEYDPYDFGLSIVASAGADVLYVRGDGAEILDAGADADGRPLGQVRDGERVWLPQLLVTILVHGYWTAVPEIASLTIEDPVSGDVAFAAHDLIPDVTAPICPSCSGSDPRGTGDAGSCNVCCRMYEAHRVPMGSRRGGEATKPDGRDPRQGFVAPGRSRQSLGPNPSSHRSLRHEPLETQSVPATAQTDEERSVATRDRDAEHEAGTARQSAAAHRNLDGRMVYRPGRWESGADVEAVPAESARRIDHDDDEAGRSRGTSTGHLDSAVERLGRDLSESVDSASSSSPSSWRVGHNTDSSTQQESSFTEHDLLYWERRRTPSVVPKGKPAHRVKKPSYGKVVKRRPATAEEEKTIRSGGWVRVNEKGEKPSDPNYKKSKSKMRPQHNSLVAVDAGEPVYIDDTQYGGPDWIKKAGDTRNA